MKYLKLIFIPLTLTLIFLTGCIKIHTGSPDGGVFRSQDKGETFEQRVLVEKIKKKIKTIGNVNIVTMTFDPQDSKTLYIGTQENGMYVTYNEGENWKNILTGKGGVSSIAVDPESKNIIYAVLGNKIFKTTDGGESWEKVYMETEEGKVITCIVIDSYDPAKVYAGTSGGNLLRSTDYGKSWVALKMFKDKVVKILINKNDTRIVYVAIRKKGLFKISPKQEDWQDVTKEIEKLKEAREVKDVILDPTKNDAILYVSSYGLFRSDDGGETWKNIKLLTAPNTVNIFSLAINPQNSKEIYYSTPSAIYKTEDGGENWRTLFSPSERAPVTILVNPDDPNVIYLGVARLKKK
ncbi:MAG: hypothetical protein COX43_00350 [Parcubacteria group bacterium CG23_combo_of_CG06-09_8_20_14_all_35_9]|nr:MAG: hypothetical protein COX43_00350 [Parcubacteria group bacterium CG23_combo_of_CG06-09_8_20_14_all_35_9]